MTFAQRLAASVFKITESLADRLPYIVIGVLFLLLAWWASRLTARLVRAALGRTSTAGHVDVLVGRMSGFATLVAGVIVALSLVGVQVSALVTSLGLVGLTLGFALKDVLANSMAGVLLLMQRPFTIGDTISMPTCEGVVRDIRVRDTLIQQADGRMVYIPNATVFNEPITNTSSALLRRLEVQVHVPLTADLAAARAAVSDALGSVPGHGTGAKAEAVYIASGVTSATLAARMWIDTSAVAFADAQDAAIVAVNAALRSAAVEVAEAE